jgi:hypothetical protein
MMPLRAGVARTPITPAIGSYLIGYGDRLGGSNAVHDDLTATALVLDDGSTRLALVALDLLCLNEHVVARIRDGIAAAGSIAAQNVMVCCSHTHAGPIAYGARRRQRRWIDALVGNVVAVTLHAEQKLVAVSASSGQGESHVAVNRREVTPDGEVILGVNPEGFVDPSLNLFELRGKTGAVLATLVNFACHGTVLGPRNRSISADWPGVMRREIEAATGAACLFLQGATGDLNPAHEWGDDDWDAMERLGREVAHRALGLREEGLSSVALTPLGSARTRLWLPTVARRDANGKEITYRQVASKLGRVPRIFVDPVLNSRYPWKTITRPGANGRPELALELQAFRLGECAILSHAAETFSEIGAAIKKRSPFPRTLFAGYTNGCVGYLPTADAHRQGGYEVDVAPLAYRMSGRFDPGCADNVSDRSVELLDALSV